MVHTASHRRTANLIVALGGNRIVECGTHDALPSQGGPYRHLPTLEVGTTELYRLVV
jgi:hypothetical protein